MKKIMKLMLRIVMMIKGTSNYSDNKSSRFCNKSSNYNDINNTKKQH